MVGLSIVSYPGVEKKKENELTHRNNVASNCIAEGEIPSNSNKDVQER